MERLAAARPPEPRRPVEPLRVAVRRGEPGRRRLCGRRPDGANLGAAVSSSVASWASAGAPAVAGASGRNARGSISTLGGKGAGGGGRVRTLEAAFARTRLAAAGSAADVSPAAGVGAAVAATLAAAVAGGSDLRSVGLAVGGTAILVTSGIAETVRLLWRSIRASAASSLSISAAAGGCDFRRCGARSTGT